MSELFLELFTEEIPTNLQVNARENLILNIKKFLDKENISYKGESESYSTPNRLVIYFKNIIFSNIFSAFVNSLMNSLELDFFLYFLNIFS